MGASRPAAWLERRRRRQEEGAVGTASMLVRLLRRPYGGAHITHVVPSTHVCCLQAIASATRCRRRHRRQRRCRHFFAFSLRHPILGSNRSRHICASVACQLHRCPNELSDVVETPFWFYHWRFVQDTPTAMQGACSASSSLEFEFDFRNKVERHATNSLCSVSNANARRGTSGWRMLWFNQN